MTEEEIMEKILNDPDFVNARRFSNSLTLLEARYKDEDGCPDHVIASALGISEAQLETAYQGIVEKLRDIMDVEV